MKNPCNFRRLSTKTVQFQIYQVDFSVAIVACVCMPYLLQILHIEYVSEVGAEVISLSDKDNFLSSEMGTTLTSSQL